ncbi:MAG TPA: hypothetical protein VEU47_18830, partial [Candidatus Cybelea sp.]|nr:hypothetical protein [Candidatus Cybelea sp.]
MIIRRRHTANFTTIGNALFDDERLAADEVGILAYLRSRPHDWEVRRPALQRRWSIGREAMKRIMFNWLRTGWCRATRMRTPAGTSYVIYDILDEPGPELTEEEIRRALSLGSSDAPTDGPEAKIDPDDVPETGQPPTGYPSLADPALAEPYVANNNILNTDSPRTESDQKIERERTRAREKHALNLAEFKRRYPTTAVDDQARLDKAWFGLEPEEGDEALAKLVPFLEQLKRLGKKFPPASWRYIEEKRWTLLDTAKASPSGPLVFAVDSLEAQAIKVLHDLAGRSQAFWKIWRRPDGTVSFRSMTPQLQALGHAPPEGQWVTLDRNGGGAWEALMQQFFDRDIAR